MPCWQTGESNCASCQQKPGLKSVCHTVHIDPRMKVLSGPLRLQPAMEDPDYTNVLFHLVLKGNSHDYPLFCLTELFPVSTHKLCSVLSLILFMFAEMLSMACGGVHQQTAVRPMGEKEWIYNSFGENDLTSKQV